MSRNSTIKNSFVFPLRFTLKLEPNTALHKNGNFIELANVLTN